MRGQREPDSQHAQPEEPTRLRWWRVFPGEDHQLRVLREWLRDLLPACAARDDVIAVASELGANAVCHTASGNGGQFSVEVIWAGSMVRVIVGDGGGPAEPRIIDDPESENGRGLQVVQSLSATMSVSGNDRGRFVQANVPWTANGGPESHQCALDGDASAVFRMLQRQFPRVPVWFGRATRQWWALLKIGDTSRLVCTSSPGELATLLAAACDVMPFGDLGHQPTAGTAPWPPGRAAAAAGPWWHPTTTGGVVRP